MKIEISPYHAVTILSFLREFVKKGETDYKFKALCESVNAYEDQFMENVTQEEWEDAMEEAQVNALIGKTPPFRNRKNT